MKKPWFLPTMIIAAATSSLLTAAPITWDSSFVITADTDVSNPAGSAVHVAVDFSPAANFGAEDSTINGLPFQAVGAGNDVPGLLTTDIGNGPAYNADWTPTATGDPDLDSLLDSHSWLGGNPATATITIEGLEIGAQYQVQLIGVGDTRACCSGRIYEPDDGEGNFTTGVTVQRGLIQSAIGTFTADASTQTILWRSLDNATGNNDPGFSGLIVLATLPADDTDNDGLPDAWEQALIDADAGDTVDGLEDVLGPNDAPATSDFDADGSSDADEFANGTDAANPDSDGDTINDGDEVSGAQNPYSGGVLGVPPGDPTDPVQADSDGDSINDFDEIDDGNGFVTDPNNADTDGDSFPDDIEINNGSDPTDAGSTPDVTLITVRGTGAGALRGGDLTDPEDDGVQGDVPADWSTLGWDWVSIEASSENYFGNFGGSEGAYDVFDNDVGDGQAKWCCGGAPQWITVEFAGPVALESFTVTSGNDVPDRDPRVWTISGSNDGVNFTPIFEQNDPSAQLWTERLQVLEFTLPTPTIPYRFFRYDVLQTGNANHQINEIEYFGFVDDTDTDGDGLPDWYEDLYPFLDPGNSADASLDQDSDGLDNAGEFANGTDPSNSDSDDDGLDDGDEIARGTHPLNADSDADGYQDGLEVAEGSDPLDPFSFPTLNPITFGAPTNITGALTDLDLTGTLVHAWNGGDATVNVAGINFVPGPSLGTEETGRDPVDRGGDADYATLLDSRTFATERRFLTIPGLTSGADYQIQIWTADTASMIGDLYSFTTDPTFADPNQTAELEGGDDLGTFPSQYVIGTFTADGTSQTVILDPVTGGVMYSAVMVRQTSAVEPGLVLTGVTQTGPTTFQLSWAGGDGTNDIEASTNGTTWNQVASGVASPTTVVADPGSTPEQLFRVVEP